MSDRICMIYVTTRDKAEAESIAGRLLQERLIACANIIPGMTSLYRWQGKIEQSEEAVLIMKTPVDLYKDVEARIGVLHSYGVPCIVRYDAADVSGPYKTWIFSETA